MVRKGLSKVAICANGTCFMKGMVAKRETLLKDWKGIKKYFRNDQVEGRIDKIPNSVLGKDVLTGLVEL